LAPVALTGRRRNRRLHRADAIVHFVLVARLAVLNGTCGRPALGRRVAGVYALLILANLAVWVWAVLAFQGRPILLGTALLAYGFGLRHAVDADHIAAIDRLFNYHHPLQRRENPRR
jgi:High-affinity nickel-transport protein